MNRSRLLTWLLVLTTAAASSAVQAQTPKKPLPTPAPVRADLLQGARAYAAALRAAPVGQLTQTAPVSAANASPVLLGDHHSLSGVYAPSVTRGVMR